MPSDPFNARQIAIAGVGLIGGSIAAALKQRGYPGIIVGVGRSEAKLRDIQAAGLIDEFTTDAAAGAKLSDLIIFCTPVDHIVEGILAAARASRPGTLITDAGSVKGPICEPLRGQLPEGVAFIGSHPLAGSEKQGYEHADADLFVGRTCVLTPDADAPHEQIARLRAFWESLGFAAVLEMSPEHHDNVIARTSHLPHAVAAALALAVSGPEERQMAATGFRDTTRIASGDPDLWAAILLENAGPIGAALDNFAGRLEELRGAIAQHDAARLKNLLQLAKTNRDRIA
jgi:prephenate dehydrogenase